ncbi:MAG: ribosomal RNA small subunit methyltransferase A [Oscillospiraceae bacterium]|nr:ribosomal RNA small subunit methyltransferase A [Oscillospiraceae bacterium]
MDLCNVQEIRALLTRHGFHFSKARGQNFLVRGWVPARIAEAAGIDETCGVLEVGPGVGPLTDQLCRRAGRVLAVEVDTRLRPVLEETMAGHGNLTVEFGDILKMDVAALARRAFPGLRPMACANLPYYITTPVLTALLEARCFEAVTVMVQKEVAQRICAASGGGSYGAFTVFCQYYAQPALLFDVPPDCFLPRPQVTSAVLCLRTRAAPPCAVADEALFFRVVRASFAQRRKTLANGLSAAFPALGKAKIGEILAACGLPPAVRGETLDIPAFAAVARELGDAL